MQKSTEIEFKSLITEAEYNRLMEKFKGNKVDFQTNHYFDTARFSLKAIECSLRVRERTSFELTLKRKKGYQMIEYTSPIDASSFEEMKVTGVIEDEQVHDEVSNLIGNQKLINFMSLSTLRMYFPYSNGILFIDKSTYLGTTDYEIEYEAKSYHAGKKEFVDILTELDIQYQRSDKKIKRAFNAYKRLH